MKKISTCAQHEPNEQALQKHSAQGMMSKTYLLFAMLPSLPALRAFDAAAKHGSFRAAAAHLHVTPTAISHHVRSLETQLGVALFRRIGREVELTEDGQRLAQSTQQAFSLLENAVNRLWGAFGSGWSRWWQQTRASSGSLGRKMRFWDPRRLGRLGDLCSDGCRRSGCCRNHRQ